MIKGLVLLVWTLENHTGLSATENVQSQLFFTTSTNFLQTNNPGPSSQLDWLKKITKCLYCWAPNSYLKQYCQVFEDNLNLNCIYLGDNKKVCLGPYTPRAKHVFIKQGKPGRELVANAEKLCYLLLLSANI